MKTLEFIFNETEIHFLLQNEGEVMVNATEMAKAFNREVKDFNKLSSTKKFIKSCIISEEKSLINLKKEKDLLMSIKKSGTFMHRILALKFAAWLDPEFEVWVFSQIDNLLFGQLKDFRDAMKIEVEAKSEKDLAKKALLANPNEATVIRYFELEETIKSAKARKRKAATIQMNLFHEQIQEMQVSKIT